MQRLLLLILSIGTLLANDAVHTFANSQDCKECHTKIFEEFSGSMHSHSIPQKDPIHNAVWAKHPQNKKQERYGCGKCHTPAADNLDKMLRQGQKHFRMQTTPHIQQGSAAPTVIE